MAKEQFIASLDVGNSKVRTLIGVLEEGKQNPTIIGVGVAPSNGLRKGQVIDVEETVNSISLSLEDAERMAGEPVNHLIVGISGTHISGVESKGVIAIGGEEVNDDDVERVLDTAQAIAIPNNKRVLKIVPKSFIIDGQRGIRYPVGMVGKKLEVEALIVTGAVPAIKNIEKCIHEAGVDIDDIIPASLAIPEAVLSKRQKELGVVVIDIGCGGTAVTIFEEGTMLHTAVVPVGGESITNDIAIGLRTSIDIAEKVKIEYGSCSLEGITEKDEIDLSSISKIEDQRISKMHLIEIIEARYHEIFTLAKSELRKIGRDGMLPAGVILTGAAVKLPGIVDLARSVLNLPVQIGFPLEANGVVEKIDDPSYATVYGLLLWGTRFEAVSSRSRFKGLNIGKGFGAVKGFFKKILP